VVEVRALGVAVHIFLVDATLRHTVVHRRHRQGFEKV
jgi:hypothetical protein